MGFIIKFQKSKKNKPKKLKDLKKVFKPKIFCIECESINNLIPKKGLFVCKSCLEYKKRKKELKKIEKEFEKLERIKNENIDSDG